MNTPRSRPRGFTLTELLVTVGIVAALTAIALPLARSAIRSSQRAGCLSNLRQIGLGIESYLQDHAGRMPELEMARASRDEDAMVLETVLEPYIGDDEVFHCPADPEVYRATGSSYLWVSTHSGRRRNRLSFLGEEGDLSRIPLVADKEAWHEGEQGTNFLYGDLSASNRIQFSVSP